MLKIVILVTALINLTYQSTTSNLTVDALTSNLKDQDGRYIFIHGINVVYKQFPYYPITDHFDANASLSTVDWINMQKWGFKAIRLYLSWEGFQPMQNKYNYTYLEQLRKIIRKADQYDIGVLLDVHQDLYSRKFCGEGFPDWLVTTLTFPSPLKVDLKYDENGIPTKQSCMKSSFFKYYATYDVMRFSHQFFTNKNGMADKFARMWKNVAAYFIDQTNVIGYDLLNQPSGADAWKNLYSFIGPGANNNKFLLPFYKHLVSQIRSVEVNKLILFEPSVADYFGGFYESPDREFINKSVMSYHTYCPFKNSHAQPTSNKKCNLIDGYYTQQRVSNIKNLHIGGMLTQFGSVPESIKGIEQIQRVLKYAQIHWQNWFYWQYKYNADSTCSTNPPWEHSLYYPDGSYQIKKIKALSHPYVFAVCGQAISQWYTDSSYSLTLKPKLCNSKFTQIFLNQDLYFPNGYQISFNPACLQCTLKSTRKGAYQLIVPNQFLHTKLTINVASAI